MSPINEAPAIRYQISYGGGAKIENNFLRDRAAAKC